MQSMGEHAPAGWYPDQEGNIRYWDGAAWTEHVSRQPGEADATSAEASAKKEGTFSKLRKAAADKQAEKRSAREELDRKQAEAARAAGNLVTSGVFGTSTIEIYDGGYVRVAEGQSNAAQPASITVNTPYEKLRSITFTRPRQGDSPGITPALEGAVGPAVAGLMKGGASFMKVGTGVMKASVPGLAVAGFAHLASAEGRKSFLTIATDKAIHNLANQTHNGFVSTSNKGHNEVGLALESAGRSVLGVSIQEPSREPQRVPQPVSEPQALGMSQAATGPTLAERLRELAGLHQDGILSDDEFGAAKAKLLGSL